MEIGKMGKESVVDMNLYNIYEYLNYDLADPRSRNSLLIGTPWPLMTVLALYFYFVMGYGPKLMENRKPLKIQNIIMIYNFLQILWNLYIFGYIFPVISAMQHNDDISIWCLPLSFSEKDPLAVHLLQGFRHYYYNKIVDLTDTIFFVLRKKNSHVTYMHVYHHVAMCIISWLAVKYAPGGCPVSVGILNGFVHAFMYTYYLLSLTSLRKWLWWKRYLTQLQMMQFILLLVLNVPVYFMNSCYYNPFVSSFAVLQPAYFLYLFIKYYIQTYYFQRKRL